ncbi:hypothetical protein HH308_02665 [Gordonia sp. TBRC 11910]|uniref:Uncharacterized protein n=1 Tax=Gordonia asplenii TaxID=2725283 RepID=A0A848KLZ9_9ACTN|nr:hypothetical protein [Gordonia asplenii]NMO00114.1 hypothetical protein [Gordonia asplenii]
MTFAVPTPTAAPMWLHGARDRFAVSLGILAFLGLTPDSPGASASPMLWAMVWFIRRGPLLINQTPPLDDPDTADSNNGKKFHIVVDADHPTPTLTVADAPSTSPGDTLSVNGSTYRPYPETVLVTGPDGSRRYVPTPGRVGDLAATTDGDVYYASSLARTSLMRIDSDGTRDELVTLAGRSTSGPLITPSGIYQATRNRCGKTVVHRVAPTGTVITVDTLNGAPVGSPDAGSDGSLYQTTQATSVFGQQEISVFTMTPGLTIQNTVPGVEAVGGVIVDGTTAYQCTVTADDQPSSIVTVIHHTGINRSYTRTGRLLGRIAVGRGFVYGTLDAGSSPQELWVIAPDGRQGVLTIPGKVTGGPILDADGDIYVASATHTVKYDGSVVRQVAV